MFTRRNILLVLVLLGIATCCLPAGAVLQQFTHRGMVTAVDPVQGTITIYATHRWGCSFQDGTMTCGWIDIPPVRVTGTVPDPSVFRVIRRGSTVETSSLGIPGGTWIGLGLLTPLYPGGALVATDLFGDPGSLPAPLAADYAVITATQPDCTACTGSVCPAVAAEVSVSRAGDGVHSAVLVPGAESRYSDPADHSGISVTFVGGQASSRLCPDTPPTMSGPQPVSLFLIHVESPASVPAGPLHPGERPGFLVVTSFPLGGTVYLDGDPAGTTFCSIPDLAPDTYEIRIEKDGYQVWTDDVTVNPGKYSRVNARLQPLYGSLRISTFPPGAEISIDGVYEGDSPLVIDDLNPGVHAISASLPGYQTREVTATIRAGQTSAVTLRLSHGSPGAMLYSSPRYNS